MTRLTNALREEIVRKIMRNVPEIDYPAKIKAFLNEQARQIAPPEIQAMFGTPLWQYVSGTRLYVRGEGSFKVCPLPDHPDDRLSSRHPDPAWRRLGEELEKTGMVGATKRQQDERKRMSIELMQVMKSTSSVENLRKVLSPDLHQFVPVVVQGAANLPVPAVVDKLKSMGMQFPVEVQP